MKIRTVTGHERCEEHVTDAMLKVQNCVATNSKYKALSSRHKGHR